VFDEIHVFGVMAAHVGDEIAGRQRIIFAPGSANFLAQTLIVEFIRYQIDKMLVRLFPESFCIS
jgi:hypothetical protein